MIVGCQELKDLQLWKKRSPMSDNYEVVNVIPSSGIEQNPGFRRTPEWYFSTFSTPRHYRDPLAPCWPWRTYQHLTLANKI